MTHENLVRVTADAIISYLNSHPDSADTIEGIHEWWIEWPSLPESMLVTHMALIQLEQAGLLSRRNVSYREIWCLT
jgi:hypothetical protein